jgi:hypothetical protein
MHHRCRIERDAAWGTETAPGYWAEAAWHTLAAQVPCYFWADVSQGEVLTAERLVLVRGYRLIIPVGIEVQERDRIRDIQTRNRKPLYRGTLAIAQIIARASHQLVICTTAG